MQQNDISQAHPLTNHFFHDFILIFSRTTDALVNYPYYPLTYCILTLSGAMTVFTFSAVDGLFVCLCFYTCGLFRMLQHDIRQVFAELELSKYFFSVFFTITITITLWHLLTAAAATTTVDRVTTYVTNFSIFYFFLQFIFDFLFFFFWFHRWRKANKRTKFKISSGLGENCWTSQYDYRFMYKIYIEIFTHHFMAFLVGSFCAVLKLIGFNVGKKKQKLCMSDFF